MNKPKLVVLTVILFLSILIVLFFYGDRRYFCSPEQTGRSYLQTTATLAVPCTGWAVLTGVVAILITKPIRSRSVRHGTAVGICAILAGWGFALTPHLVFSKYGQRLWNSWADVSCFVTEGFGMAFPFIAAPLLTAAALSYHWLVIRDVARD